MKQLLLTLIFLAPLILFGQDKKICISIDDVPAVSYGANNKKEINEKLIKTFDEFNIPAIGYVVENQLYRKGKLDSSKVEILKLWLEAGYDLGNHTYSHLDYNVVTNKEYFDDIIKGEKNLRKLMEAYGKTLKYFRHPYLRSGMTAEKTDALKAFLVEKGYIESPVTIDNDEYLFAKAYHRAFRSGNDSLVSHVGKSYIIYMEKKLHFFEKKSDEVFDRNIAQTLLIHANQLNADYLDELAAMFIRNGYEFVSQDEVLKDEAYASPMTYYARRGHSWIFRWGMSMGFGKELMEGDIIVPQDILSLAMGK